MSVKVNLRKGKVTVDENESVDVFLPKADGVIEEEKRAEAKPTRFDKILLVDDEEYQVFPTKKYLERLGYTVTAMTSSLETLELFKKDPWRYDLIITDLTMPCMSGDRLASEVVAIRQDMPVILATGDMIIVDEEKMKQCGITAFLFKPFKMQDLAKTIRLILDEK